MLLVSMVSWMILLGCPLLGFRLGSSTMLLVALLTLLSGMLSMLSSAIFRLLFVNDADQALGQLILLIVLLLLVIPFAHYLNRYINFTMEPFDWIIGSIAGIATGMIVTFYILSLLLHATTLPASKTALKESFVVRQCVNFEAWHNFEQHLLGLTESIPADSIVRSRQKSR